MIVVNISNVRSAEISSTTDGQHWVTLRFGNNDRAIVHTKSWLQAAAIAGALNGALEGALTAAKTSGEEAN